MKKKKLSVCKTCGRDENEVSFYKSSRRCKKCHKIYAREHWRRNYGKNAKPKEKKVYPFSLLSLLKEDLNVSQLQLSLKINLSRSYVGAILRGKKGLPSRLVPLVKEYLTLLNKDAWNIV